MNVVVVMIDSLRRDHVGVYGNDWVQTPNLDALARESLLFDRAFPESIPTICSRRSMHTGIRTWPFRDWKPVRSDPFKMPGWQPIPEDQITLPEVLQGAGYQTMFVTDVPHLFRPFYNFHWGFKGYHFVRGQERDLYRPQTAIVQEDLDRALSGGEIKQKATDIVRQHFANTRGREVEEDWFTPQVFGKAMEFLEDVADSREPFFLLVDVYDPHEPWDPPAEYISLYDDVDAGPTLMSSSSGRTLLTSEKKLKRMHALYAAELTMVDRWLGRFLQKLDDLKLTENTLLVLLSDHGHAFGEHGFAGKVAEALYPELVDIVFMVRHPEGKGAGERSDFFASMHDVTPTVLGALGVETPVPMEGVNLARILEGEEVAARPHATAGYNDYVWARDEDYVLISSNDGSRVRLFDVREDPAHENNVARARPDVAKRMFEDYVLKDAGGPLPRYDA